MLLFKSLCEIGKKQLVEGEGVSKLRVILLCQDWKMLRAWVLESKADLLVVETAVSQPRYGVFTRFFNHESEPVVIKSQLSAPPSIQPWAG